MGPIMGPVMAKVMAPVMGIVIMAGMYGGEKVDGSVRLARKNRSIILPRLRGGSNIWPRSYDDGSLGGPRGISEFPNQYQGQSFPSPTITIPRQSSVMPPPSRLSPNSPPLSGVVGGVRHIQTTDTGGITGFRYPGGNDVYYGRESLSASLNDLPSLRFPSNDISIRPYPAKTAEEYGLTDYIRVVARVRPLLDDEKDRMRANLSPPQSSLSPSNPSPVGIVQCLPEKHEIILSGGVASAGGMSTLPRTFVFDDTFSEGASQEEVYRRAIQSYVHDAFSGLDTTVLTIGSKNSGKSYTVEGQGGDRVGAAPRALSEIFETLPSELGAGDSTAHVTIRFLEIQENNVYNLLSPTDTIQTPPLPVPLESLESPIVSREVTSVQEATQLLHAASLQPRTEGSHRIITFSITFKKDHISTTQGSITFVDMASAVPGRINAGIDALQDVVRQLGENTNIEDVRYSQSALTSILRDSLGGRGKTLVVATVSPVPEASQESSDILAFANSFRTIRNKPTRKQLKSQKDIENALESELSNLREQLRRQRAKDGVFLPPDLYESMQRQISMHSVQMSDLSSEIRLKQQKAEETQAALDASNTRLRELEANSTALSGELFETNEKLEAESTKAREALETLNVYQDMQPKLYARAQDLQNTLRRMAVYTSRLEAKNLNLSRILNFNKRHINKLRTLYGISLDKLENATTVHLGAQKAESEKLLEMLVRRRDDLHKISSNIDRSIVTTIDTLANFARGLGKGSGSWKGWSTLSSDSSLERSEVLNMLGMLMDRLNASMSELKDRVVGREEQENMWLDELRHHADRQCRLAESMLQDHAAKISQINDILVSSRSQSQLASAKRARRIGDYIQNEKTQVLRVVNACVQSMSEIVRDALSAQYHRALDLLSDDHERSNATENALFETVQGVQMRLSALRNHTKAWGKNVIQAHLEQGDHINALKRVQEQHMSSYSRDADELTVQTQNWAQSLSEGVSNRDASLQNLVSEGQTEMLRRFSQLSQNSEGLQEYLNHRKSLLRLGLDNLEEYADNSTRETFGAVRSIGKYGRKLRASQAEVLFPLVNNVTTLKNYYSAPKRVRHPQPQGSV